MYQMKERTLGEKGRKLNGMRECRLSCGYMKTTSWKYFLKISYKI